MVTDELRQYVNKQIARLQVMPEHPQKAALANLRRGVGRVPGDIPEIWGLYLQNMPEEWMSLTGEPTREEWAIYLAVTLYALHQQGHSMQSEQMCAQGVSLGKAMQRLALLEDRKVDGGIEFRLAESSAQKRLAMLATATNISEVAHHMRGVVQLLRAKGIPMDYPQLAIDLYWLQFPEAVAKVRLRWGQDFYRYISDTIDTTDKEEENS